MDLTIQCLSDPVMLAGRQKEWDQLASSLDGHQCFHHYAWFDAAWAWRRLQDWKLKILFFYHQDTLVGICPLMLGITRYRAIPVRTLEFLTTPDTQFCDIICHRDKIQEVCEALAEWLKEASTPWTELNLSHIPATSPTCNCLRNALSRRGINAMLSRLGGNPYIELDKSWQTYYSTRSRRLKKGNNLVANKLSKSGTLSIQWLRGQTGDPPLEKVLADVIQISAHSWKQTTGLSLDRDGPGAFIHSLSSHAHNRGWLSVWILRLDDQPIAMEYQLIHNGIVYALRADFDESYGHLSPGTYLNWQLLKALFGEGLKRYYMGPGNNAYKQRWMEGAQDLCRLTAYNRTATGWLWLMLHTRILPMARNIKSLAGKRKMQS